MSNLDSLAIHLIREGQWTEAVKLYRDELGLSFPQAEKRVDRLAEDYELHAPGRLINWLWIAFGGGSIFFMVAVLDWIR